jgi:hypothetical protein
LSWRVVGVGKLLAILHFLRMHLCWKNAKVPEMWADFPAVDV